MEELLQWFGFGEFSPKQLIPARKLSSRSTDTPFSSDTISYQKSVPVHYLWKLVHKFVKLLDLERMVSKFITLPPQEQLQEIMNIEKCNNILAVHIMAVRNLKYTQQKLYKNSFNNYSIYILKN